jgi:hypothetical protein
VITPVFSPAALGLTSGRVVGFSGTQFTSTLALFAASGELLRISSGAVGDVPLTLRAFAGQTANLFESQDSAGAPTARVTAGGNFSRRGSTSTSEQFGDGAVASNNSTTAIGFEATASGNGSTAIGRGAIAGGDGGIAIGNQARSGTGTGAFVLGTFNNTASNFANIFVAGVNAAATGAAAVAVGRGASAGTDGVAVGDGATASGNRAVGIGASASATHSEAIAIGRLATSAANGDVCIGASLSNNTQRNLRIQGQIAGVNGRDHWSITSTVTGTTDGTETTRQVFSTRGAGAPREVFRIEGQVGSTAPMIGFLGASAVARPTVTGSRGGNAALASLLTQLAALGLITDSTTA